MSNIDQLTVISTEGASQLSRNGASGFSEGDAVLNSTVGRGIKDLLGGLVVDHRFACTVRQLQNPVSRPCQTESSPTGPSGSAA